MWWRMWMRVRRVDLFASDIYARLLTTHDMGQGQHDCRYLAREAYRHAAELEAEARIRDARGLRW